MRSKKAVGGLLSIALLMGGSVGCSGFLTRFAAGSSISVFSQAAPALQASADPDWAEIALPGSMATMEGLLFVVPDSEPLHLNLARAWASYGFGFLEDHMEQAEADDNEALMEHYRARASAALLRARAVSFDQMNLWHPEEGGVEGHVHHGVDAWRAYLGRFTHEQAPTMFWGCYAWARWISNNRDDVNAIADLPLVQAMAERIVALDPEYNYYAPRALMAGLMGATPEALGGRPAEARQEFDRIIELTHRHNLMYMVLEARLIAVSIQDRAMYRRLLDEVLATGDVDPENRLSNQLARRRARRYLAQIENLFMPDAGGGAGAPAGAEGSGNTAPAASP
jgi:hypothetical protein